MLISLQLLLLLYENVIGVLSFVEVLVDLRMRIMFVFAKEMCSLLYICKQMRKVLMSFVLFRRVFVVVSV